MPSWVADGNGMQRIARAAARRARARAAGQEVGAEAAVDVAEAAALGRLVRGDRRQRHVAAEAEVELERPARALGALRIVVAAVVGDAVAVVVGVEAVAAGAEDVGAEDGRRAVDVAAVDVQQRAEESDGSIRSWAR